MGNLKFLISKIKKFFELAEAHVKQIEQLLSDTKKPCHSIINQSAILRAVLPEDSIANSEFNKLQGFREILIEVILSSLEEEFKILEKIRDDIDQANEILLFEQRSLETLFIDLTSKDLINLSELNPCSPSLEHIITWAQDIWSYYHSLFIQISLGLLNLNFKNEESVHRLEKSLKENIELKKQITKILSFNLSNFEFLMLE